MPPTSTQLAAGIFVRNSETNQVRQLTVAQAARVAEGVMPNNFSDPAGVITGTIFSGSSGGSLYSRRFDRWYDPSILPTNGSADDFFASQPDAVSHDEPTQWWTDPTGSAQAETSSASALPADDSKVSIIDDASDLDLAVAMVPVEHVDRLHQVLDKIELGHHESWPRHVWEELVAEFRKLFPRHDASTPA